MRDALILVVIMALAAAAVWCQPPSGYICGKVYWRIGNDTGAAYVDVYCKPVAGGPTTHTETNCCGLYALENLLNNTWYEVWAVHMKNVSWPCPHAGSLCDTTIYTETLGVFTSTNGIDFTLALDSCSNDTTTCSDPCPDAP